MEEPFGNDADDIDTEKLVRRIDKHTAGQLALYMNEPVPNFNLFPDARSTNKDRYKLLHKVAGMSKRLTSDATSSVAVATSKVTHSTADAASSVANAVASKATHSTADAASSVANASSKARPRLSLRRKKENKEPQKVEYIRGNDKRTIQRLATGQLYENASSSAACSTRRASACLVAMAETAAASDAGKAISGASKTISASCSTMLGRGISSPSPEQPSAIMAPSPEPRAPSPEPIPGEPRAGASATTVGALDVQVVTGDDEPTEAVAVVPSVASGEQAESLS
tara:strand:- start:158 stop:1009 length:852 start_codon:yes stop_codon:yes gene_type:complete